MASTRKDVRAVALLSPPEMFVDRRTGRFGYRFGERTFHYQRSQRRSALLHPNHRFQFTPLSGGPSYWLTEYWMSFVERVQFRKRSVLVYTSDLPAPLSIKDPVEIQVARVYFQHR